MHFLLQRDSGLMLRSYGSSYGIGGVAGAVDRVVEGKDE